MSAPTHRRGSLLIVAFLLLLCVLFEQYGIAPFFPMVNAAGSFQPMIVFLDIPLSLPTIDWLPVSILFAIFYAIVISRTTPKGEQGKRVWKALTGWWLLVGCMVIGGGGYYLIEGYLPKQVINGIDSFGVRADLTLPYPSGELIHLHGSVIQLLFAILGIHLMMRRTAVPQPVVESTGVAAIVGAAAVAEAQAIINAPVQPKTPAKIGTTTIIKTTRKEPAFAEEPAVVSAPKVTSTQAPRKSAVSVTPPPVARPAMERPAQGPAFPGEPPTCRLTTPPPIAIVMPRPAPGIGKAHPCFVMGGLSSTLLSSRSNSAPRPADRTR